jgi:hypothetical protein
MSFSIEYSKDGKLIISQQGEACGNGICLYVDKEELRQKLIKIIEEINE